MLDEQEIEEREDIETSKQRAIERRDWGYTVLIWAAAGAAVCAAALFLVIGTVVVVYGVPGIQKWTDANAELAAATQNSASKLDAAMTSLQSGAEKFDRAMSGVEDTSNVLPVIANDLQRKYLPQTITNANRAIESAGQSLYSSDGLFPSATNLVQSLTKETGSISNQVQNNLITLNENQKRLGEGIDNAIVHLNNLGTDLSYIGMKAKVYVDDPAIAEAIKNSGKISTNIEIVTEQLAELQAEITAYSKKILNPPPQKGVKGFLNKFILVPLKTVGGVVYLWLKITQGV